MTDYGIKVSKPGSDAKTASLGDLIFHSDYPVLKIKSQGTGQITYTHDGAGNDILVDTHDLGYQPLFSFMSQWYDIDASVKRNSFRQAPFIDTLSSGSISCDIRPYVNNTQLRFSASSFDGMGTESVTLDFIYFIYYDPEDL